MAESHPGASKRFYSRKVRFFPEGGRIFIGQRKRISEDEKQAWDENINIYFQSKALVDSQIMCRLD